jgi:hypothetical protein
VRAQRLVIVLSLAAALVAACTFANVGSVRISPEVTRKFESLQANPGYRYWYLNQENNPYGVIGVDREYAFDGGPVWREVEAGSAVFRKVVGLVESFPVQGSTTTGYTFSDHQGRPIGVWYSSLGLGITVDAAAKAVSPSTTSPWRNPR